MGKTAEVEHRFRGISKATAANIRVKILKHVHSGSLVFADKASHDSMGFGGGREELRPGDMAAVLELREDTVLLAQVVGARDDAGDVWLPAHVLGKGVHPRLDLGRKDVIVATCDHDFEAGNAKPFPVEASVGFDDGFAGLEVADDAGFDLEAGREGGKTSVVSWRIRQIKERRTSIEIAVYPHAVQHVAVLFRWLPHLMWVRSQLKSYLRSVLKGLDWFISHGEPVRRNQFGSHRWFSPPIAAEPESGA